MLRDEPQKLVWDQLWSREVSYHWDSLSQTIYDKIIDISGGIQGKRMVEAGSGSGKISLRLAAEEAEVTLVDYSKNALYNSRSAFYRAKVPGTFILSDIREMQLPDHQFDLTWNAGVLEHFDEDEQVTILREMIRVTKPGGTVLVITPFAECLPYRAGKEAAEQLGTWMYGTEYPIFSLKDSFERSGIALIEESSIGFLNSLDFLDFIQDSQTVKHWLTKWYHGLTKEEKCNVPGYLLVSVGVVGTVPGKAMSSLHPSPETQLSPEDKLSRAQTIISSYHAKREKSHYLSSYKEEESTYWFPLLAILDSLLVARGTKVLDIGAAYGTLLMYSVLSGAKAYGLDMIPDYWSEELEQDYGVRWNLCNIEAEEIPGKEQFDVILFTEILEHMNYNPLPVLRKIKDRLTPGGSLLISTPWKRHFAPNQYDPDLLDMPYYQPGDGFIDAEIKYYTIDEMYALAENTAFQVKSFEVYNGHLLAWFVNK
ncbi:2-polyprenyl-3-methyl-5-hydroxy-6-metoxy-1,4-benzoquinol methylase [Paenibacillus sp. LBL]|uniref:methyltransferase domain-containing protein n=1 Tax=Paenibacillus sp. LBL TaxID=2940563 RepID=UPI002476457B|nr:methyltransferase domain-containing protein [Paenibacillus sp. LBL]MDH6669694.1 2-polyprenyl-3-methyl-5-hydroxy-6-metoxy-1,4-benzoquinol methylase [Paenibacillus sp. LBL]